MGLLQRGHGDRTDSELPVFFLCLFDFLAGDHQFLADMIFVVKLFLILVSRDQTMLVILPFVINCVTVQNVNCPSLTIP